jgi:hypothetical protein
MKTIFLTAIAATSILSASACFAEGLGSLPYSNLPPGSTLTVSKHVFFPASSILSNGISVGSGDSCTLRRVHVSPNSPSAYQEDSAASEPLEVPKNEVLSVLGNSSIWNDHLLAAEDALVLSTPENHLVAMVCDGYARIDDLEHSSDIQVNPAPAQILGSTDLQKLAQLNDSSHLLRSPAFSEAQVNLNGAKVPSIVSASISSQDSQGTGASAQAE